MNKAKALLGALSIIAMAAAPAGARTSDSSGRKEQAKKTMEIPHCTKRLGTIAIVEPDNQWWREFNLGSPEATPKTPKPQNPKTPID